MLPEPWLATLLEISNAVISIIFVFFAFLVFLKVRKDNKKSMVSFKLNPDETVIDFKILFAGSLLMVFTLSNYLFGGYIESEMLINLGRSLYFLYILIVTIVLCRWVRRFK